MRKRGDKDSDVESERKGDGERQKAEKGDKISHKEETRNEEKGNTIMRSRRNEMIHEGTMERIGKKGKRDNVKMEKEKTQ